MALQVKMFQHKVIRSTINDSSKPLQTLENHINNWLIDNRMQVSKVNNIQVTAAGIDAGMEEESCILCITIWYDGDLSGPTDLANP